MILLVMTDGRGHYLRETLKSLDEQVTAPFSHRVIHDDSQNPEYRDYLNRCYPDYEMLSPSTKCGFGGSIQSAWTHLRGIPGEFVFHLEDDFIFNEPVNLSHLAHILSHHEYLVQLALRRQAWNDAEVAAGGLIELNPQAYEDRTDGLFDWLEHRLFFTTNPSVYRRELCYSDWPSGQHSEGVFTHHLLEDPNLKFGFWGTRDSSPSVNHIGAVRTGEGY